MDTTADIKKDLISRIAKITDEFRLKEMLRFLEFQSDISVFETSNEEKDAIADAQSQIEKGAFLTHDEAENQIEKWLKK
ncbi:hypothetical protein [Avrilella dinanensis]|uniref:Uncharacterized protein n=1 Tax=Avrilella dinanensis TaxID=2008672 RepID=A0A2M9R3N4_9FLAO|nr:hypothetical protein [Avrilella dinanensis]PJR03343.1 hypothetical protein CDL10_01615 [Avrilella dinanensis]